MAATPFDPPYPKKPMLYSHDSYVTALFSIEQELGLLPIEILHCRNRESFFFAPVTLTLSRWPSYTNLTRIPSRCASRPKTDFSCQGFRKLSYCLGPQTNRQTYTQTNATETYHSTSRVVIMPISILRLAQSKGIKCVVIINKYCRYYSVICSNYDIVIQSDTFISECAFVVSCLLWNRNRKLAK